jgi:predicted kinase
MDAIVATAHLIHGYLGAGKTSFAAQLEQVVGGIHFSADERYLRLYAGDERTGHLEPTLWGRLSAVLNELWPRLLGQGIDVILDFGFWTRRSRDEARALARAVGAEAKLYAVVCAHDVAKARCLGRNAENGWSFLIDEAAFEALRVKFQPVEPDEAFDLVDTTRWGA